MAGIRKSSREPAIGVVVHGPAPVYSGELGEVLTILSAFGRVKAASGGTMCRAALLDTGLDKTVDMSSCEKPSVVFSSMKAAALVLVNHGKTLESGMAFGSIVASRLKPKRALIQAERALLDDGKVILWDPEQATGFERRLAKAISRRSGLSLESRASEKGLVAREGSRTIRKVRGIVKGEPVFINSTFIGRVTGEEVTVESVDGYICSVAGVDVKRPGLEKIKCTDAEFAVIKSGELRDGERKALLVPARSGEGCIAVIDHCAFSTFERIGPDVICALTVGDDTTAIAGDILARLGIRTIGVVDEDQDSLLSSAARLEGSVDFVVECVTDDEAGAMLADILAGTRGTFEAIVEKAAVAMSQNNIPYRIIRH